MTTGTNLVGKEDVSAPALATANASPEKIKKHLLDLIAHKYSLTTYYSYHQEGERNNV